MEAVRAKGKSEPVEAWVALRPKRAAGERQHSGALVGRARELDVLRGIWEQVSGERVPHLVTVIGPAGIGKTRLTQEFDRIVEELGGRTVHGRSLPYRESSAYFAFAMQVKQLCGIFDSDPPEVALPKLREHVADLPSGVDAETVDAPPGDPARARLRGDGRRPRGALLLGALLHRVRRPRPADAARLRGHPLVRPRPARPDRAAGRAAARPADHAALARPARAARLALGLGRRAAGLHGAAAARAERRGLAEARRAAAARA